MFNRNDTKCDGKGCEISSNLKQKTAWLKFFIETVPSSLASISACAQRFIDNRELVTIAEDATTDRLILAALALHPTIEVRQAVADNRNTPLSSLLVLAQDESADVRYQLAESYHLPRQVLQLLIDDANPYVSARAETTLNRFAHRFMCCAA